MSIKDLGEKIKFLRHKVSDSVNLGESADRYYIAAVILLVGFSSFGLGRLSVLSDNVEPVSIEENGQVLSSNTLDNTDQVSLNQTASVAESIPAVLSVGGKVVASKNGTKYYFPWCGGVSKIAETNKVWFNSEAEAKAKGYGPAANCKGLK